MKKLIYICIALMVFMPSCKKDEINKPAEDNTIQFRFKGDLYQRINPIEMYASTGLFILRSDYSVKPRINIYLSRSGEPPPFGVGTFRYEPGIPYTASIITEDNKHYEVSEYSYSNLGYLGTFRITFSKYSENYVEGTFEFASDYMEPFTVTGGYFKVRQ
jgi:hypothetical protein